MNDHLINLYNAIGLNRIADPLTLSSGESAELPLAEVLVISRVLFAVVMIGFIGYFFDRIKQSILVENKADIKDFPRRK
jgi:hypothetical protein